MSGYADRVQETSTTGGTGTLTLLGAVAAYQSFSSAFATGTKVMYCITDTSNNWEVGEGTYTTSGTTLSRDIVYASSNAGALVTFVGTQTVFCTLPAAQIADRGTVVAHVMHNTRK